MNIIVCIKQVPSSSNVKVDPVTGVLIRDGIESKIDGKSKLCNWRNR